MNRHLHEQNEPALIWEVNHGLTTRTPIIETYVTIDGVVQRLQPKAVRMLDLNTIHVEWSIPRTGKVGVI